MSADKATPRRLGRGLDALLGQKPVASGTERGSGSATEDRDTSPLRDIPIADIRANQYQPRTTFDDTALTELRESIRASGLLQPVTVRQVRGRDGHGGGHAGYELVAGERRLRAVRDLGWTTIPAIVRDYDDKTSFTLALIENLQRADLNPIEEAEGYARLVAEFSLTQQEIAELVGKDRSTVANLLRVLHLPQTVKQHLAAAELTLGHVRPLLALTDRAHIERLAQEAIDQSLSVRAIEDRVRNELNELSATAPKPDRPRRGRPRKAPDRPTEVRHVEDMLRRALQTDVDITLKQKQQGEVSIQFYSYEDLNRILEIMGLLE